MRQTRSHESEDTKPISDSLRSHMAVGLAVVVLLIGGFGGWAATAELAGAVIADGTVVVDSNLKKIQHATGGIVGEIHVRDGDKVSAGDLLVRLDATITRANLAILVGQIDEFAIRKARLVAERDHAAQIAVPTALSTRAQDPAVRDMIAGERVLFESRRAATAGKKSQLMERMEQLRQEITGLEEQQRSKALEIELVKKELVGLLELQAKDLIPSIKVTSMQRESARLSGERGQLIAAAAQARGKITETELQIIQLDQDMKAEVARDMRDIQAKEAEVGERVIAARDQLKRIDIRSPQAGVVHQMSVHTVGGVITASEPLMLIVPEGDTLVIEAKIAPKDIDHVRSGLTAFVRFPAFNQRTTPEFIGEVSRVAADLGRDQQTGQTYFVTRITLSEAELKRMGALKLKPGMPAEVQIRTTERTALSYLMKPLTDHIAKAFKEQ